LEERSQNLDVTVSSQAAAVSGFVSVYTLNTLNDYLSD